VRKAGGFTFLDTSGAAFTEGLRARPDLVKPNDIELGQVTGLPVEDGTSILFAAKSILESGAGQVIVSRGRAGALLVGPEGSWEGLSPQVQEVNPIGAGDAMVAGLIFGLSTGMSAVDALRWGLACGASAASEPGTSMGTREKINSLFEKATVEGI
jgi:fructose-1-phosphate kinase PfkB-like protein